MKDYGFIRVAAARPLTKPADVEGNVQSICGLIDRAAEKKVSLLAFPELCVTGYTCGDLFGQELLIREAENGVKKIVEASRGKEMTIAVGVPVKVRDRLYNCAAVIRNGNVKGLVPKIHLPSYNEFYEARWFSSGADFLSDRSEGDGHFVFNGKDTIREGFGAETRYAGQKCMVSPNQLFSIGSVIFGVEICEDLWTPIPPSSWLALAGARVIVNLSASNEVLMKHEYRKSLIGQQSARTVSGYVYCSSGYGESTQDTVYSGASVICENGALLAESERFSMEEALTIADLDHEKLSVLRQKMNTFRAFTPDGTEAARFGTLYSLTQTGLPAATDFGRELLRHVEPHPFVPGGYGKEMEERCREIFSIQVTGLASRLSHIGCRSAVIGISGGLDSTLALLVTTMAADRLGWQRDRIIGVTMPGYGTTDRTYRNAMDLMKELGVSVREISIKAACDRHFQDIGHDSSVHDVTYENSQARERTQILMDIANQTGGITIGTGDLSELALGWATYNGDHMSMYGVNSGIPKTLVRHLVRWIAENLFEDRHVRDILTDIIDTPISPELLPADGDGKISQKTEDLVGPYELHDFFLYNFFRFGYSPDKLFFLAKKAFCIPAAASPDSDAKSAGLHQGNTDGLHPEEETAGHAPETESAGRYSEAEIKKWLNTFLRRFFNQQFKRSCLPDGPKVGSVTLSPRGDWRMPSDASAALFLNASASLTPDSEA